MIDDQTTYEAYISAFVRLSGRVMGLNENEQPHDKARRKSLQARHTQIPRNGLKIILCFESISQGWQKIEARISNDGIDFKPKNRRNNARLA